MRLLPRFPLLAKELIEQSARRRTYVVRCIYALVVLVVYLIANQQVAEAAKYAGRLSVLGSGREMFAALIIAQAIAVLLLTPALAAVSITHEKEQGTLIMLLLTPLKPWSLLMQKWLSKLIAVCGFLLIGVPLLAVAYAHGGLEVEELLYGMFTLLLLAMQASAIGLLASAWFRSSAAAFVAAYLLLAALYTLVPTAAWACEESSWRASNASEMAFRAVCPLVQFAAVHNRNGSADLMLGVATALGTTALALVGARIFLVRRAQLSGANPLLRLFKWLDAIFVRIDQRMGLNRQQRDLPETDPIAWRELNRRSLASTRYLVRIGIPVLVVITIGVFMDAGSAQGATFMTSVVFHILFGILNLAMIVMGASLISAERTNQTLDVLLTTPLSARTILFQKMRALRRIHGAGIVLLALTVGARAFVDEDGKLGYPYRYREWLWWIDAIAIVLVPIFCAWTAVAIGLLIRRRVVAIIVALVTVLVWSIGMLIVGACLFEFVFSVRKQDEMASVLFAFPGMLPVSNAFGDTSGFGVGIAGNTLIYVVAVCAQIALLWWWCRAKADCCMRRGGAAR